MGRAVDEAWIEEAIERYQRIERLQAQFERTLAKVDVTVRSPDGLVEVVVTADGVIRDVAISESARGRPPRELSRAVQAAVTAAADAASWARTKLHQETFGQFRELASETGRQSRELASETGRQSREVASETGLRGDRAGGGQRSDR